MGLLSVGADIIEIRRIDAVVECWGQRFLTRIYTPAEVDSCRGRAAELAVRFAAKEAVSKALGTGLRGIGWREMEIYSDAWGKPLVRLHGRAAVRARDIGLVQFAVSLSHCDDYAVAFVVASD